MAKLELPFPDVTELFDKAIVSADLKRFMNVNIIANNSLKDKVCDVKKASPTAKLRSNDDVYIYVNQNVFDALQPLQQQIVIDEALSKISFNTETETITILKPDVITHSTVLTKYTFEVWQQYVETVKSIREAEKQAEDEAKAAKTPKTRR